ncbi:MAG: magnesium/cobalt transporter CorA [Alphaproteobacteria bacterium]|nr:magnesium/cobalt transporter CorA [Alphaproteobacteria bacterium]
MTSTTTKRSRRRRSRLLGDKRGLPPGTPVYTGDVKDVPVEVRVLDYDTDGHREHREGDIQKLAEYHSDASVTWINLDGVHQVDQVATICRAFGIHPLWMEDILNPSGRPKAEILEDRVLVVARMVHRSEDRLVSEQVSMVLGPGFVLTFQERAGDVWEPLRERIRGGNGRIRKMRADYLLHALLDDIVDHYFVALEDLESRVDGLEANALDPNGRVDMTAIFDVKSELADFRRSVWPMRESVSSLLKAEGGPIDASVTPYFRDLYDHVVQVMDILETSRERVVGVYELHLAVTSYRLNDIMKVLTIVSTIFIPATFVAGVYGMNFDHMPELHWGFGYPFAWLLMLGSAGVGGYWVYTRRWLT